jgi:hypothetical protein
MKIQIILIVACLTVVACDKMKKDKVSPEVTITSPTIGYSVADSTTISIGGSMSDEGELHEALVKITRDSDGVVLFSTAPTVGELTSYTLNESYVSPAVSVSTNVTLTVTAVDHTPNTTTKTVAFVIHP